jgi:hypothetical protein
MGRCRRMAARVDAPSLSSGRHGRGPGAPLLAFLKPAVGGPVTLFRRRLARSSPRARADRGFLTLDFLSTLQRQSEGLDRRNNCRGRPRLKMRIGRNNDGLSLGPGRRARSCRRTFSSVPSSSPFAIMTRTESSARSSDQFESPGSVRDAGSSTMTIGVPFVNTRSQDWRQGADNRMVERIGQG